MSQKKLTVSQVRKAILREIFLLVASHRRLWRKEPITGEKMGKLLTLTRKLAYKGIKLK